MPQVESMEGARTEYERAAVWQMPAFSFLGGPREIRAHLEEFVEITQVDEIMATSHIYDHSARLRSYELFAEVYES